MINISKYITNLLRIINILIVRFIERLFETTICRVRNLIVSDKLIDN